MSGMLFLCACSSVTIKKAQLQTIHSAAILSLQAAQRIPEVQGQGVLRKMDAEIRQQLADDALDAYTAAFEALGWEVASTEEITQKETYRKLFQHLGRTPSPGQTESAFRRYTFSPTDLYPIWIDQNDPPRARPTRKLKRTLKEEIGAFLTPLRLGAGILIQVQYCFRTFRRNGNERVAVTAASALQLIDHRAQLLYESSPIEGCGGKSSSESTDSMEIEGEDWIFDPMKREPFRAVFKQASVAEARRLIHSIPVTAKENSK